MIGNVGVCKWDLSLVACYI